MTTITEALVEGVSEQSEPIEPSTRKNYCVMVREEGETKVVDVFADEVEITPDQQLVFYQVIAPEPPRWFWQRTPAPQRVLVAAFSVWFYFIEDGGTYGGFDPRYI